MGRVLILPEKLAAANRYANLIRKKAEREYAFAYLGWLRNGAEGLEPLRGSVSTLRAAEIRGDIARMRLWEGADVR